MARCALAFVAVLFVGFLWYRLDSLRFRDDLNIPVWKLKGLDFRAYHVFATDLLNGNSPYMHDTSAGPNPYPPLYTLFVAPFAMMTPDKAYIVWVILSAVAFLGVIRVALAMGQMSGPVWLALAVSAFVLAQTYPVPFVWERGTPEFFILLFMAGGLFLLTRQRFILAICLLTVATHFKLYPLILGAFVLVRGGFRWATAFAGVVAAAFFVLGWSVLKDFYNVLAYTMREPRRWMWPGNHSLKSLELWCEDMGLISPEDGHLVLLGLGVTLVVVFCWMLWGVYRRRRPGTPFSPAEMSLLGMAFSLMCLLPTFSHDYKLSQQFFPLMLLAVSPQVAAVAARSRALQMLFPLLAAAVASLYLPRFGEFPKTAQMLVVFGLYTAVTELLLRAPAPAQNAEAA